MRATSPAQFAAVTGGGIPEPERVRDDVWAIALPLPDVAAHVVPYTLAYALLDDRGDAHLVDTGWASDDNWRRLAEGLATLGRRIEDVASVTITHLHADHLGLAERVRAASGASLAMHRVEQEAVRAGTDPVDRSEEWGVPAPRRAELRTGVQHPRAEADVLLEHGDRLQIGGRELTVLHTPGHTTGHICVRDATGLLFTGDHVLPTVFPGLGLGADDGSNPVAAYHASLELVLPFADDEVLPAHGYRFDGLQERVRETAQHHRERTAEVARVLEREPGLSVWELASRLTWTLGWDGLRGGNLRSALAQTAWHRELVGG